MSDFKKQLKEFLESEFRRLRKLDKKILHELEEIEHSIEHHHHSNEQMALNNLLKYPRHLLSYELFQLHYLDNLL